MVSHKSIGVCWSCQRDLVAEDAVLIDHGTAIQCCRDCWQTCTSEERMKIALKFHDRSVEHGGFARACDAVVRLVDRQLELQDEEERPPWDRGEFGPPDWN